MAETQIARYLARLRDLEEEKRPWLTHYQSLGELFLTRKTDFTRANSPGEFLQDNIFDNTPQFAAYVFASVCLSMLWPDAARTFNVAPVAQLKGQPGVEGYFRAVTATMHTLMDKPEAGLQLALMEHFLDQGVFGTSGIATLDGPSDDLSLPVIYDEWDVKTMFISENSRGFIDTIYLKLSRTVRQVFEEYGQANVSSVIQERYAAGKYDDKVEVLKVLEPKAPMPGKEGFLAMPWRTVHLDIDNRVIMREGGFEEMPVAVARIFKRAGEVQGRSPGMVALPAAINLNNLSESIIVAAEKQLDPPLALLDDGRLGGAVIRTGAGELSVLNASGRLGGEKPIFPLFTVGEMQSAKELKEQLIQEIMQSFFLDRLLDLNNKTMMTAYETSIRNRLRGESTGSLFARQIMEVLSPTIKRTFKMLYRKGYFGVIEQGQGAVQRRKWEQLTGKDTMIVPEIVKRAIAAGLEVYDIEYISPAQRFMQAEKLQGMFTAMDGMMAVGAIRPEILDNVDLDMWVRDLYKYGGSPNTSLRTPEDLRLARAALAERQNAAAALQAGKDMAQIQRDSASARQMMGTMK